MAKKDKTTGKESKPINFGRELPVPKSSLKPKQSNDTYKDKEK